MQRNYQELSPFDFEELVRDLLQEEIGGMFEVFPPGRDGGVDVRLLRNSSTQIIAQCKHSPFKSFADIRSALKKEASKVAASKIAEGVEYRLATSASLTAENKQEIIRIFGTAISTAEHVWGRSDIDNLLNRHAAVEERHYKLYMAGIDFLQRALSRDAFFRRETRLEDLQDRVRVFVQTPALKQAKEHLREHGVCIISGAPGVGKTTLADMILLDLSEKDYDVVIVSDVDDIERAYQNDRKQLFYYDDFLGQNSIAEKLGRNEDGRLLSIINRIERESGSRHLFILTTREYILAQAKQVYGRLNRGGIDVFKYVLDLRSYNQFHRAHILYNHVFYSDLGSAALESLLADKKYSAVIKNEKYSPRLIEMAIRFARRQGPPVSADGFADYLLQMLANPADLWADVFEDQLGDIERDILFSLITLTPRRVVLSALYAASRKYCEATRGVKYGLVDFKKSLDVLDGVFLRIMQLPIGDEQFVGFANPSFPDYLRSYLGAHPQLFKELLDGFLYFDQYQTLADWGWPSKSIRRQDSFFVDFPMPRRSVGKISEVSYLADEIAEGLVRTVDSPQLAPEDPYWSGSSEVTGDRISPKLHRERFERIAEFVRHASSQLSSDSKQTVIEHGIGRLSEPSYWLYSTPSERERIANAIEHLHAAVPVSNTKLAELLTLGSESLWEFCRDPEDYITNDRLLELSNEDRGWLKAEFVNDVPRIVSLILDMDDYSVVDSSKDALEAAAQHFEVDLDGDIARIQDHLDSLPPEYDGSDDDDDMRRSGSKWDGGSEARIDTLFDSLRDLDR